MEITIFFRIRVITLIIYAPANIPHAACLVYPQPIEKKVEKRES